MGRQHQGMDRPGVLQVQEGSGEQRRMEGTGCEVICGAPKPGSVKVYIGKDKTDRGRDRKTTSGNGQAWSSEDPRGQWRTVKNGENWLRNHLRCPNDPRG